MLIVRGAILLLGVVALIWLATENAGTRLTMRLFTRTYYDVELNVILALSFIAGLVVCAVGSWIREAQLVLSLMRERKAARKLQEELEALRNLPLDDGPTASQ